VLSHVWLPGGFALDLCLKHIPQLAYLEEALIGRRGADAELVLPGPNAYDGSYTSLELSWKGIPFQVQSATDENGLVILVKPLPDSAAPARLEIETGLLWSRLINNNP